MRYFQLGKEMGAFKAIQQQNRILLPEVDFNLLQVKLRPTGEFWRNKLKDNPAQYHVRMF